MIAPRYRDRLGKPVPSRLEIVWRGRESLAKMRENLHRWRGGLAGAVAGARTPQTERAFSVFQGVPIEEVSALVEKIDGLLAASMPQIMCQCKEKWCPFCEGKKWLNASDVRRISNQEQLPALSAWLSQSQSSAMQDRSAGRISESAMLRILWLLAGPPEVNLLASGQETACSLAEQSDFTATS